jgi:hypothetical protein
MHPEILHRWDGRDIKRHVENHESPPFERLEVSNPALRSLAPPTLEFTHYFTTTHFRFKFTLSELLSSVHSWVSR